MSKSEEIIQDWHNAKEIYLNFRPDSKLESLTEIVESIILELKRIKLDFNLPDWDK